MYPPVTKLALLSVLPGMNQLDRLTQDKSDRRKFLGDEKLWKIHDREDEVKSRKAEKAQSSVFPY